jgi:drug/metabolite transporter (DMT)-like permease
VAISLFALITLLLVFRDFRHHREHGPLILAAIAAATMIGTMYILYSKMVESVGLLLLLAAALWGWQINRKRRGPESVAYDDY